MNNQNMENGGVYQAGGTPLPVAQRAKGHSGGINLLDPLALLRMVMLHWLTVLLLVVCGGLAGVLYIQKATPLYKAESAIEMSIRRPRVINNDAVIQDYSLIRDEGVVFNTRFEKFKSPAMERLATGEYFKRYPEDEAKGNEKGISKQRLASLIRDVIWKKDPTANIVRVSYYSSDPQFAARLVNVLSHCAGLLMQQENQAISDEAVKWLVTQVEDQRQELEQVEGDLARVRDELKLDSIEQRKNTLAQALISVSGEKESLISTLASRKTVYQYVLELKKTDPNLEMLPTGLPKEEQLNELLRNWRAANDELLLAAGHYTKIHPEYRKAAEKEQRARDRLEQFIDVAAKAVQNEIDLLEKQLDQVDERIARMEKEALNLELQRVSGMQRIQRIERKRDAADNAYQAMLRRMEEARLSADENMAFTKVIRDAEVPILPVSPNKPKVLVLSVFLGGLLGAVFVVILSVLTDKIESVTDLKAYGLNLLGAVPPQKNVESRGELATLGLRDKFSAIVEVFAGINAQFCSGKYAGKTRVVVLSSAMPGEGKTVSACNLAICSAMNGSKTLLIDGDLRRPQIANIFSIGEDHLSLLEWLSRGDAAGSVNELISRDVIENLDVVSSRPMKDVNPAELIGRGQLIQLLSWAREHYDRVIIDSPPIGAVGDAQVLANLSDAVILVSRIGKTRRRAFRFSLAKFEDIDAYLVGCIANDVPHSLAGKFSGAEGYAYNSRYGGYKPYGMD